jgi:hypothetical protein
MFFAPPGARDLMTKSSVPASSTLTRSSRRFTPWKEQSWQKLWLATQESSRPWRSLALVPAGAGITPDLMTHVAVTLSRTGMMHLGCSIHVADATKITLGDLGDFAQEIARCTQGTDRVLIALAPVIDNVTSVAIAQACDCALLCALRGQTQTRHAKHTVAEIGPAHFIGSTLFDPPRHL